MPTIWTVETGKVEPEDKGGPRVGVGARALIKRSGDGSVTMQLRRGDGGNPETYPTEIRSKQQAFEDGIQSEMTLATLDLELGDFTEIGFQLRIVADGVATLSVVEPLITTEPSTTPGI